jgi:hypothetical protein
MPVSTEDFDRQFSVVVGGAERTRGILYFFCIVLIVNLVFFVEDAFDTPGRRLEIMNGANACLGQKLKPDSAVPSSRDKRSTDPDDGAAQNCRFYYRYVVNYYHINVPATPDTVEMDDLSKTAFLEKYKAVLRDATESLSTTVPFLNIKIDRNTGLILQNSLGALVLFILLLSTQAETKSVVTIGRMVSGSNFREKNHFRAQAVLDTHVFSRLAAGRHFVFVAVFAPPFMQLYKIYQDFSDYKIVFDAYGNPWGSIYLGSEAGFLVLVSFVGWRCFAAVKRLRSSLDDIEQKNR